MNLCKDCKHFGREKQWAPRGYCNRWKIGYDDPRTLALNEVQVEGDEGWGMSVGPEFGCVLWEAQSR